ncbi:hypothetical protein PG984_009719 [Apiospora sp. TS-2023a]
MAIGQIPDILILDLTLQLPEPNTELERVQQDAHIELIAEADGAGQEHEAHKRQSGVDGLVGAEGPVVGAEAQLRVLAAEVDLVPGAEELEEEDEDVVPIAGRRAALAQEVPLG